MTRPPNTPPQRQRRRLVFRIPISSSNAETPDAPLLRTNIGHLTQTVHDNTTGPLSLLFLRLVLPDEVVEQVLLFLTAHCGQNPPRILRDTLPPDYDEFDGCLEAWIEGGGDPYTVTRNPPP